MRWKQWRAQEEYADSIGKENEKREKQIWGKETLCIPRNANDEAELVLCRIFQYIIRKLKARQKPLIPAWVLSPQGYI